MKVKRYQYNSIPFVAIVDQFDCPVDPYVSAYISRTTASLAINTSFRYANELLFVLQYFGGKGVDLANRVASGELLSEKEYLQFYDSCCLHKKAAPTDISAKIVGIDDKALRNIISANARTSARVSNETLQGRLRRLRDYLCWLFDHFHEPIGGGAKIQRNLNKLKSRIKLDEQGLARNKCQKVRRPEDSVIPEEVFSKLLEMILPSSPNNVFRRSKLRNYLIVSILCQSGIRRGALAKLKISDLHTDGAGDQISIYRSVNDITDTRADKPNQKTKSHLATIGSSLMLQVQVYIDTVRNVSDFTGQHDFLFVSENNSRQTLGKPLSLKAVNAIFTKISKVLGYHIHPHLLRHKWNETFDIYGSEQGVNPALLEDMRKYAMGWVQNTSMNQVYNENRLALKTRELMRAHQVNVDPKK